jgi:hypothetical protein
MNVLITLAFVLFFFPAHAQWLVVAHHYEYSTDNNAFQIQEEFKNDTRNHTIHKKKKGPKKKNYNYSNPFNLMMV